MGLGWGSTCQTTAYCLLLLLTTTCLHTTYYLIPATYYLTTWAQVIDVSGEAFLLKIGWESHKRRDASIIT